MVLNMADFGKFWKSLQTPWDASKTVANRLLTPCGTFCIDLGWFRKGHKFAVFQQKPWAIAHGFEHGGISQVLGIAPNSLKRLQNACKYISNSLRDFLYRFGVISQGSQIRRFSAKTLGYSPWFWQRRILASSGNRSKLPETRPKRLQMDF